MYRRANTKQSRQKNIIDKLLDGALALTTPAGSAKEANINNIMNDMVPTGTKKFKSKSCHSYPGGTDFRTLY